VGLTIRVHFIWSSTYPSLTCDFVINYGIKKYNKTFSNVTEQCSLICGFIIHGTLEERIYHELRVILQNILYCHCTFKWSFYRFFRFLFAAMGDWKCVQVAFCNKPRRMLYALSVIGIGISMISKFRKTINVFFIT